MPNSELSQRHAATQEKMLWFEFEHLKGHPREVSAHFAGLANRLLAMLEDGPQFTIALDRLREAKDRAVSQAITDARNKAAANGS